MSDAVNPYQSPGTVPAPVKPQANQGILTETMLVYLKGASPWLRFIGILGFIGAGITALWGVLFFVLGSVMAQIWSSIPGFESVSKISGSMGAAFGALAALIIIGAAVITFILSRYLYRFGTMIRSYLGEGREHDLELAFKSNKSFWKFIGIIYIVYLAIIPLTIIISAVVAIASAFS